MIDDDRPPRDAATSSAEGHPSRERSTREYGTARITVEWRAERCIHSANCVRAQPKVFDPRRHPWVDVAAADAEALARAVQRCPSGALHYVWHDREVAEPLAETAGDSNSAARRDEGA